MSLYQDVEKIEIKKGINEISIHGFNFIFHVNNQDDDVDIESINDGVMSMVRSHSDIDINNKLSFIMEISHDELSVSLVSKNTKIDLIHKKYLIWTPKKDYKINFDMTHKLDSIWEAKNWHNKNIDEIIQKYNSIMSGDIYKFSMSKDDSIGPDGKKFRSFILNTSGNMYLGVEGFLCLVRDIKDIILLLVELSHEEYNLKTA